MFRLLSTILFIFLLFGCSKAPTIDMIDRQKANELSIVNTVKAELKNEHSRVIILATYLSPIKVKSIDSEKENFIVSIYVDKKATTTTVGNNPFYNIYLDENVEPLDITPITFKNRLLKLIPIKNRWSSYYLITFPKQDKRSLKLTFENEKLQKATLTFSKEP